MFITTTKIVYCQYELTLLASRADVPSGYDEEGSPPIFRAVVGNGERVETCETFDALRRAVAELKIPLAIFCERFPADVAEIISRMNGLSRVIRNTFLYQFLEQTANVSLVELAPKVAGSVLVWHDISGIDLEIRRRQASTRTMELME